MNLQKTFFLLIIVLLFINLIVLDINQLKFSGKIKKIEYSTNKIELELNTSKISFIIFTNKILDIKENDQIIITGQKSTYKNQQQIIVNKIEKIIPYTL